MTFFSKKILVAFLVCLSFVFFDLRTNSIAQALTIESDPQYVVMNFSTINELDWAAPEEEWQSEVRPQVITELRALKAALPPGTSERRLAWSTLMEYMNFPLDEAGPDSPYVIKLRRIFEIAEAENIPVFIPLNGFQWWDELPELYNWWDEDGTKTSPAFFARQDNPADFKQRFIAGYNPDNKWNVEWESWSTPMQLNWRNWGGGEFRLAPPPNLTGVTQAEQTTYREVLEARLSALLTQIELSASELEAKGKGDLFAGLSLGTEISLNASATPKDEFMPYGYRALQDAACPTRESDCVSATQNQTPDKLQLQRGEVVGRHLHDLSRFAIRHGIPKQRIYTHVWGEAGEDDPKYAPYAPAAFNAYSRPGMSFYGFAENPNDSPPWSAAQKAAGQQPWGAVEYSVPKEPAPAQKALRNTLEVPSGAKVTVIYNWSEHKDTPAIAALSQVLNTTPVQPACEVPEALPATIRATADPTELAWRWLSAPTAFNISTQTLEIYKGSAIMPSQQPFITQTVSPGSTTASTPKLTGGVYTWRVVTTGCNGIDLRSSEPRTFTISYSTNTRIPGWVQWWLEGEKN